MIVNQNINTTGPTRNFGHAIALHPNLIRFFGSTNAAIMFQQIRYWCDRTNHADGVFKTMSDFTEETGLSRREQESARKVLTAGEYIIETHRRVEHKLYFRINWQKFNEKFEKFCDLSSTKSDIPECTKRALPNVQNEHSGMAETSIRYIDKDYIQRLHTDIHQKNTKKGTDTPTNNDSKTLESANAASVIQKDERSASRKKTAIEKPTDVSEQTWIDFLELRKAKRSPLTQTALNAIRKEASKCGLSLDSAISECCARGWIGFKADWLSNASKNGSAQKEEKFSVSDYVFNRGKYSEKREVKDIFDIEVLDAEI